MPKLKIQKDGCIYPVGRIVNLSKSELKEALEDGIGVEIDKYGNEVEQEENKKEPIKKDPEEKQEVLIEGKKDYISFDSYIQDYVDSSGAEQLQAVADGSDKFNIPLKEARRILDEKIKSLKDLEKRRLKEEAEKEKLEKKRQKELERQEREAEKLAEKKQKKLLLDELEFRWETCGDDLFQCVCEEDWRKAKFYFVKRFLLENTYSIGDESIIGIKTFKDNGDIIIYSPQEGIYIQDADIYLASEVEKRFGEKATNMQVKEIIESIKRQTFFDREDLQNQPKNLRPLGNGLWNIQTKKLIPFSPQYIFLNKISINYVEGADCRRFKEFLKQVLDTPEEREVLKQWMGYCLLNDVRFSKALLLFGDGENGKSVLLKAIKHFLGEKNVTSLSLQYLESNPFAPVRLFGKIGNIFADLPKKALGQTSVFKMVVAGDSISGEKKGKDSFEFTPYAKMMFSCNEVPRTPDRTRGFFRRWIILKFNQHFPEGDPRRDENLFDKLILEKEMEGILQFALEGLYKLLEQKGFTEHMTRAEIQEFWLRHSDSVSAFGMDMVEVSLEAVEKKVDVYEAYEKYCKIQNYPAEEPNHFWRRLKEIIECQDYNPRNDFGTPIKCIKGVKIRSLELFDSEEGGSKL